MSLLKKLAGLAVGAAAVGAVAYVLQNREHHDDEYEHIWGPEDEVEPETDSAEPAAAAVGTAAEAQTDSANAAEPTFAMPELPAFDVDYGTWGIEYVDGTVREFDAAVGTFA